MTVAESDVQSCRRCSRCKEILGLEAFSPNRYWCKVCESVRAKEYRRTAKYRASYQTWVSQPEVQERRRNAWMERSKDRGNWRKTVRGRLSNMRSTYRSRARKYRKKGNLELARLQIERADAITQELLRLDRKASR